MGAPKGRPKPAGSGRQPGQQNKTTQLLKDAVLKAAGISGTDLSKNKKYTGLERYLVWLSKQHPVAFTGLLSKVLPMQIGGTSDEGDGINIQIVFSDNAPRKPMKTIGEGKVIG